MYTSHLLLSATLLAFSTLPAHADEGHGPAVNNGTGIADQYVSPARLATSTRSRAEVMAEYADARRHGEIPHGDLDRSESQLHPELSPRTVVAGRTRADVRRELAEAIEAGDIADGDLGRTRREINPQRYAAAPRRGTATVASSTASAPVAREDIAR